MAKGYSFGFGIKNLQTSCVGSYFLCQGPNIPLLPPHAFQVSSNSYNHTVFGRMVKKKASTDMEAERRRTEERLLREKEKEEQFKALKSKFFGLVISDNEISVKVLESIEEYCQEGNTQHICVFSSSYYLKKNTLVLSARIGDTIIETVEVDLQTLKVVQCHGKYNKDTEYHDRIIDLVNSNARLIKERMTA